MLFVMLVLLTTLSGWTQSSRNWEIKRDSLSNDTIVSYNFTKTELGNLRNYVTTLESIRQRYDLNLKVIDALNTEVSIYKTISLNKDEVISYKNDIITVHTDVNDQLSKDLIRFRNKAKRLPYWIGGGFIGGIILCQLVK